MSNNSKERRTVSYAQATAEKGAFLCIWGKQWGLSVYPAYGIDKVKFSFIEVGAEGKGKSFDIYIDTIKDGAQCFDNWSYDVMHGIMTKRLAQEKQAGEKYPKAYLFATGENGEKTLGICNASQADGKYVINAGVVRDGKKVFANVQVGFHDLRHLAENFEMTYEKRRLELAKLAEKVAGEYRDSQQETEAPVTEAPAAKQETVQAEKQTESAKPEAAKRSEPAKTEPAPVKEPPKEAVVLKLKTSTPMTACKNNKDMAVKAITEGNETRNVIFLKENVEKVDPELWSKFLKRTMVEGCIFSAEFAESEKGNLIFQGFKTA